MTSVSGLRHSGSSSACSAREGWAAQQGSVNSSFRSVLKKTDELATDLRDLSHALHSSRLQHLGLRAALHELCSGVQKNLGIPVRFKGDALARPVPPDIAFCLYRVAQEALHNAGQHSRAAHIDVTLSLEASVLRLRIEDAGKGFDYNEGSEGLGLASMRERLHMIGGELVVQSRPGRGTVLTAQVDLPERPPPRRPDRSSARDGTLGSRVPKLHSWEQPLLRTVSKASVKWSLEMVRLTTITGLKVKKED